ncbi:MFS transporter, ACS family, D-galactonate transporter [Sphingomonas sp. F9_3S_D5_B_2]
MPLLGAAVFLNYVDRGAIGIAAPLMKSQLGLTATQFGLIASAFFWVYAPVQLAVGWLVDRFSVYRLMAAGLLLWAAATLGMGFAAGFVSLLLLRIILGIGETIAFPGGSKIIARHVPAERRGMANAAMALGIALGPAAGTFAGGLILASFGWRAIFFAFGVVTLLWLLPWQRTTRGMETPETAAEPRVPLRELTRHWSLWAMSIAHFASNYVFYFVLTWLPLFLTKTRGLSVREMTYLATLGYLAQAAAVFLFGWFSDRWTGSGRAEATIRRGMLISGQVAAAAAVFGLASAHSPALIGALLCVAGVATAALSLNIYAVGQMFAGPRAAGTWIGFQNALGNVSGIVGPIITGWIVDRAGFSAAFMVTAAVTVAGAIWWLVAVPRIRPVDLR